MAIRTPSRVALLVDTSTDYSTHVIQGIAQFVRDHRPWQLLVQPRGENERSLMPRHWQADGVIARVTHRALARDLSRRRIPVVNVSLSVVPGYPFPQVTIDEPMIGEWAAAHLLERGFQHFAYCGNWTQSNYVDRCGPAFAECLRQKGYTCHVRQLRRGTKLPSQSTAVRLQRWLMQLPRPVGILASDANDAHLLREQCRIGGLRMPEDVAIIAGEDDELLCAISHPPLSCVELGAERVGYQAARLLSRLLAGRDPPREPIFLPPRRIITRHSTDTLAIDDSALAQAVRYIRDNAGVPIQVNDMLRAVPLSRRALEQRFRRVLGRSPAAEIRRAHLERAKELLISTDWPTPRIAMASGFSHTQVMNQVFRRELNMTPTEFRRRGRSSGTTWPTDNA